MTDRQVEIGQEVGNFAAPGTSGDVSLVAQRGRNVVLYFYPKDSTPGCTTETREFGDSAAAFEDANAIVYGVSRDSLASHRRFKEALGIPFDLISDPDEALCTQFGRDEDGRTCTASRCAASNAAHSSSTARGSS